MVVPQQSRCYDEDACNNVANLITINLKVQKVSAIG